MVDTAVVFADVVFTVVVAVVDDSCVVVEVVVTTDVVTTLVVVEMVASVVTCVVALVVVAVVVVLSSVPMFFPHPATQRMSITVKANIVNFFIFNLLENQYSFFKNLSFLESGTTMNAIISEIALITTKNINVLGNLRSVKYNKIILGKAWKQ